MGRGGPPEPQLVRAGERPDVARLLEIARGGGHAASDYLEDAVLAGVATVGCRRCGEGPAGEMFDSNVAEGVRLALSLDPGVIVLEGSGAALPPVAARPHGLRDARGRRGGALSDLGPLRLLRSDLVVCSARPPSRGALRDWDWAARSVALPARARAGRAGARRARARRVFTTARPEDAEPRPRAALERHGRRGRACCRRNLARRDGARARPRAGRARAAATSSSPS